MQNNLAVLDNTQLMTAAPSIFATQPFIGMSNHYQFIPTIEIVENMREQGFFPVMASQSKTRCAAKQGMQRHMIKFRQEQYIGLPAVVGNEVPEIILVNSHDGSSLYELMMGIFRFVCSNGMVAISNDFGSYQVRHSGLIDDLIETTFKVVADFPKALSQIEHMKSITLNPYMQLNLATKAMLLKYDSLEVAPAPSLLLEAKREDDTATDTGSRDLWTTFNVVQENLIKGGIESKGDKRTRKTRPIAAIQDNLRINKDLWQVADEFLLAA